MKKKIGIVLGLLTFFGLIFFPFQTNAKGTEVKNDNNLHILIQYKAVSK